MRETEARAHEVTLLELVDRLIDKGVVLSGDITISVADVDLIALGLRLVLTSAEHAQQMREVGEAAVARPVEPAPSLELPEATHE